MKRIELKYLRSELVIEFVVSLIAGLSAFIWAFFLTSETLLIDKRFEFRKWVFEQTTPQTVDDRIVIVSIPEDIKIRYGNPAITPRKYLADLIIKISQTQPKIIALDYIFDQPSFEKDDAALVQAIKKCNNVIIGYQNIYSIDGFSIGMTETLHTYIDASYSAGYLNITTDARGITRYYDFSNQNQPSFIHEIVACYFAQQPAVFDNQKHVDILDETKTNLINTHGISEELYTRKAYINYRNVLEKSFAHVSSEFIINNDTFIYEESLKNKIVIIGTGSYNDDLHKTPFSSPDHGDDTHGVLINAMILKNIIDNDFIYKTPWYINLFIMLLLISGNLYIGFNYKFMRVILFFLGEILLYGALAFYLFTLHSILIPMISVTFMIFIILFLIILARIVISEKQYLDAREMLANNISTHALDTYSQEKTDTIFHCEHATVVYFICTLSTMDALGNNKSADTFLRNYFSTVRDIVFASDGCVSNQFSFGILCFWNLPLEDEHAVDKLVDAVEKINNYGAVIHKKALSIFKSPVGINIIIDKGTVLGGCFPDTSRYEYTIAGECVNNAKMILDAYSKNHTNTIILTESGYDLLKDTVEVIKYTKKNGYLVQFRTDYNNVGK